MIYPPLELPDFTEKLLIYASAKTKARCEQLVEDGLNSFDEAKAPGFSQDEQGRHYRESNSLSFSPTAQLIDQESKTPFSGQRNGLALSLVEVRIDVRQTRGVCQWHLQYPAALAHDICPGKTCSGLSNLLVNCGGYYDLGQHRPKKVDLTGARHGNYWT